MSDQPNRSTPRFNFLARLDDGGEARFTEVSGLVAEEPLIGYRGAESQPRTTTQKSRMQKLGNLTLKRGLVAEGSSFRSWIEPLVRGGYPERRTLHVELLAEHEDRQSWTLRGALPTKVRLHPGGESGDIAIETLEIAHEGLELDPES